MTSGCVPASSSCAVIPLRGEHIIPTLQMEAEVQEPKFLIHVYRTRAELKPPRLP